MSTKSLKEIFQKRDVEPQNYKALKSRFNYTMHSVWFYQSVIQQIVDAFEGEYTIEMTVYIKDKLVYCAYHSDLMIDESLKTIYRLINELIHTPELVSESEFIMMMEKAGFTDVAAVNEKKSTSNNTYSRQFIKRYKEVFKPFLVKTEKSIRYYKVNTIDHTEFTRAKYQLKTEDSLDQTDKEIINAVSALSRLIHHYGKCEYIITKRTDSSIVKWYQGNESVVPVCGFSQIELQILTNNERGVLD